MSQEESGEKKVKIRPRTLGKGSGNESNVDDGGPEESGEENPSRWDLVRKNRLKQSGTKFPARGSVRDAESPGEPSRSEAEKDAPVEERAERPEDLPKPEDKDELWANPKPDDHRAEKAGPRRDERRKTEYGTKWKLRLTRLARTFVTHKVLTLPTVIAFAVALYFASAVAREAGVVDGVRKAEEAATKEDVRITPEVVAQIDAALAELRSGDTARAVTAFGALETENRGIASLTYLAALAAMQNGDIQLAEKKVAETIAKRERVSDALALQAVLETQKRSDPSISTFGDGRVRSEEYLRRAMAADAASPFPMIELATLLRYQNRDDEAIALLEGARNRLNPVDSHAVVEVSIALARLQNTPDANLGALPSGNTPADVFSGAYIAMRRGDFTTASTLLATAKARMPFDLFDYLVNDPALRRYANEPTLAPFYQ